MLSYYFADLALALSFERRLNGVRSFVVLEFAPFFELMNILSLPVATLLSTLDADFKGAMRVLRSFEVIFFFHESHNIFQGLVLILLTYYWSVSLPFCWVFALCMFSGAFLEDLVRWLRRSHP